MTPPGLKPQGIGLVNNTRVVPARLFGVDEKGRRTEFLLVEKSSDPSTWDCLARPGRRGKECRTFDFGEGLVGIVAGKGDPGHYLLSFSGRDGEIYSASRMKNK